MNKVEFYNSVVNVYNETGQGVPGFLRMKMSSNLKGIFVSKTWLL
jgi:hypothetical protein